MTSIEIKLKELEERLAKLEELNGIPADPTLCPECKIGHLVLQERLNVPLDPTKKIKPTCSHCGHSPEG